MTITERDRRDLYTDLEEVLGENAANNLMQLLPFQPVSELATRTDVHASNEVTRVEMAELRAELKGEMAELRGEMKLDLACLESRIVDMKSHTTRVVVGGALVNAVAMITAIGLG